MSVLLIILLPFVGVFLPLLMERYGRLAATLAAAAPTLVAFAILMSLAPTVFAGDVLVVSKPWVPELGLTASLRVDGLGWLFALLILGIGLLVIQYAYYYLSKTDPIGRFFSCLLLFMGAMLGVVLSENVLLMALFWEITSLSSFLLIGYWSHKAAARQGARMALTVTGLGGLSLFAGLEAACDFDVSHGARGQRSDQNGATPGGPLSKSPGNPLSTQKAWPARGLPWAGQSVG